MPISPRPPRVEVLEPRQLCSATLLDDGTLRIEGTRRSDVIEMSIRSQRSGRILVSVNGVAQAFRAKDVTRIDVLCGLGNDRVNSTFGKSNPRDVARPTTLLGGGGDDVMDGNAGDNVIDGGDGNDRFGGGGGNNTLSGGAGHDTILAGRGGRNVINGGDGNDQLIGGRGDDLIDGGPGNDNLDGQGGRDTLRGDNGNDALFVGDGNGGKGGLIEGGRGDDFIYGNPTATLFGNAGFDTFNTTVAKTVKDAASGDKIFFL
jgi:Ca2+-binding RTX toxin-like protein